MRLSLPALIALALAAPAGALAQDDSDTDAPAEDTGEFVPSGGRTVECSTGPDLRAGALLLGLAGAAALRRRRARRAASTLTGVLVVATALSVVGPAQAAPMTPGMDVQRFDPSGTASGFTTVYTGRQLDTREFSFDVFGSWAYRPLQRSRVIRDSLIRKAPAIDNLAAMHLRAAVGVRPWFQIALSMPVLQGVQTGWALDDYAGPRASPLATGDLMLELGFRPLSEKDHGVGLAITPFVTAPTGTKRYLLTDGVPTFGARVALSGTMGPAHLAAFGGYKVKLGGGQLGRFVAIDDEVVYGAGLGFYVLPDMLRINAEVAGNTVVGPWRSRVEQNLVSGVLHTGIEANLNLLLTTPSGFALTLGGGPGLTPEPGIPAARAFLGLSYLPWSPDDHDNDGLVGRDDECPMVAEDDDGFEDGDGCPEADNDRDSFLDVDDACPDKPEDFDGEDDDDGCPDIRTDDDGDGVFDDEDECPDQAEDRDGRNDRDGCPDPDDDGDGILDEDDDCPLEAEDLDGFRDDDGCPDRDDDGDGIPDGEDACPLQAEDRDGVEDDDGCPDVTTDGDNDGVNDADDKCPDAPEDRDGWEDEDGCPDPDDDGDGIPDGKDLCPRAAENVNGVEDDDGCPDDARATLAGDRIVILDKILFYVSESRIKEESFAILDAVRDILRDNPDITRLRIEGHTDSQGGDEYNQDLSERRALAVRQYLIDHGIAETRLLARGYGEKYPIAPNNDDAGRAKNRRVEFIVLKPDDDGGADATEVIHATLAPLEADAMSAGAAAPAATVVADGWRQGAFVSAWLTLAAMLVLGAASLRDVAGAVSRPWRSLLGAPTALLVVCFAVATLSVPGPWSTNNHDFLALASVAHGPWTAPGGLGEVHGYLPLALLRGLAGLTGGRLDPTTVCGVVAVLALVPLGALARILAGHPAAAPVAIVVVGLHPAFLRLARTPSPFLPYVAAWAATMVALEAWLVGGRTRTLGLAAACAMAALQCRGEAFAVVPASVVLWVVLRRPGTWRQALAPRPWLVAVVVGALVLVPRAYLLHAITAVTGVPMFTTGTGAAVSDMTHRTAALGLVTRVALVLVALGALAWAARPRRLHQGLATLAATVAAAVTLQALGLPADGHDPGFDRGGFAELSPDWLAWAPVHGLADPRISDPLWLAAAVVGVAVAALVEPAAGVWLAAAGVLALAPYLGAFATVATQTRMAMPAVAVGGIAVASGLARAGGRAAWVPALALVGWTLGPRLGAVQYTWAMQQEWSLITATWAQPGPRVVLGMTDVPPGVAPGSWNWEFRRYLAESVAVDGVPVVDASRALADPESVVGGVWIRGLGCQRALLPDPRLAPGSHPDRWLVGGRPLVFDERWLRADAGNTLELATSTPCWADPAAQRCADEDATDCARWACADPAAPPGPPYVDPVCALVESTFVLDPIATWPVPRGNLSGAEGAELSPDLPLGLYRIVGTHAGDPPAAP